MYRFFSTGVITVSDRLAVIVGTFSFSIWGVRARVCPVPGKKIANALSL